MYVCQGKVCYIEELTTITDQELHKLMRTYSTDYKYLVSDEPIPESYEIFKEKISLWFSNGRMYQFLVRNPKDKHVMGTIFFYGYHKEDFSVKCSCYFIPEVRGTKLTVEALALCAKFALLIMKIEKILFSVYIENKRMLKLTHHLGAEKISETTSQINPNKFIWQFSLKKKSIEKILSTIKY